MSDEQLEHVLDGVPVDRRTFIRRVVAGTAFAVPVVASFGMNSPVAGGAMTPNGHPGQGQGPDCMTPNGRPGRPPGTPPPFCP